MVSCVSRSVVPSAQAIAQFDHQRVVALQMALGIGELLPLAEVVTPNIPEAEILSGLEIKDAAGMEAAA